MYPLPLARAFALDQRQQYALGEQDPGAEIVDRDTDPHRSLTRQPGNRHQPAHALGDLVNARPFRVRPGLAETGNAAINDARVDLFDAVVIDAKPIFYF